MVRSSLALVAALALACVLVFAGRANAEVTGESVALLPLDAEARLEIYGQPIASELARGLVGAGLDVVVVGPKMAVPERAVIVIDGTIVAKGDAVTVSVRLRERRTGATLESATATAPTLTAIDKAADELSAKVVPAVTTQLAAIRAHRNDVPVRSPNTTGLRPTTPAATPSFDRPILIGTDVHPGVTSFVAGMRTAIVAAAEPWAHLHHQDPSIVPGNELWSTTATRLLGERHATIAMLFTVKDIEIDHSAVVPLARARVELRVFDREHVMFDRVLVTDTIVGDRGMIDAALLERVARAVLEIAVPQLRRVDPGWR